MGSMAAIWRLAEARRSLVVGTDENSFSTSWRLRDAVFVGWWRSMGGCCSGFSVVRLMDIDEEEGDEELRGLVEKNLPLQRLLKSFLLGETTRAAIVIKQQYWFGGRVSQLYLSFLTKKFENFF